MAAYDIMLFGTFRADLEGQTMTIKKLLIIAFAMLFLLTGCAGEGNAEEEKDLYAISAELMDILWNVDYKTFTADRTTEFANKYYEESYLAYYLEDPDFNAGITYVQQSGIVSRLLGTEDAGIKLQTSEGVEYQVETLRVQVILDCFSPEDPETNYFEEGKTYTLIYEVYFLTEDGTPKIAGFSYGPEEGEMLPPSEREALTEDEKEAIEEIAKKYLDVRYHFDADLFSPEQAWDFYSANLTEDFLLRDEITQDGINSMLSEYRRYHVSIRLISTVIESGEQKTYVFGETLTGYYYWVRAVYEYAISADEEYLNMRDLGKTATITETMYFVKQADGRFQMAGALYGA